ncbi:YiiD C-terminal domain-containing protein [Solilutibacter silvestris]|uniref:YiiD C-terminal domain-containing protein n=1 Tax=Solilutibacter silvestris TaxID=1645665 RepID=UPI003D3273B5
MSDTELIARIEGLLHAMPPVAALQPRLTELDDDRCNLHAPLAANINDKGCAFGGSLVSLMTLAGWGLVTAWLERRGIQAEVYVADSQVKYRAPLYDDLDARAQFAESLIADAVLRELADKRRVSFQVRAEVRRSDGRVATSMESRYVAVVPDQTGPE